MKDLLIATRNQGKLSEITVILQGLPFRSINLDDLPTIPREYVVEETAMTFEGNAIIKAMTIGKKTGVLTLAEDSGLVVDALGGRPGVYTARYAPGTDEDRYRKLLDELKDVSKEERTARFQTVVAIYDPASDRVRTCEGVYEGIITEQPRGEHGFGYDPIFYNTTLQKTNAEMTLEEKNNVSHRGKALRRAREILKADFS